MAKRGQFCNNKGHIIQSKDKILSPYEIPHNTIQKYEAKIVRNIRQNSQKQY